MPELIDQMQRRVEVPAQPQRIISLVPSQTELLFDLGLADRIVGITKFCVHPKELCATKTKVGGTKNFNFDRIDALKPDLIIGNKEENYQEGIEALEQKYPVWVSDIFTLGDALQMMAEVGKMTDTVTRVEQLAQQIQAGFDTLLVSKPLKVAYFIWRKPYMGAGNQNFIDEMITCCGWQNVLKNESRYPEVNPKN